MVAPACHPRSTWRTWGLLALLLGAPSATAAPPPSDAAALAFLEGSWATTQGRRRWEATFTSPQGGVVLGASKEIQDGSVISFELERFRAHRGQLVREANVNGTEQPAMELLRLSPDRREAVFGRQGPAGPERLGYRRGQDGKLVVRLEGGPAGATVEVTLSRRGALAADPTPPRPPSLVEALAVLEGSWQATAGDSAWEACYTSPAGGEVLSATKEIVKGKAVTCEFERFFEREGRLTLQIYVDGKPRPEFPLRELDAKAGRAVFENQANPFPMRLTYQRTAQDRLTITLEGDPAKPPRRLVLEFKAKQG